MFITPETLAVTYEVRRLWFAGATILKHGQPLCFQESPSTAEHEKGFPFDVELPNTSNLRRFAGIVPEYEDGKVGPCKVDVIVPRPGDIMQVLCGVVHSGTTGDQPSADDPLVIALGYPTQASAVATTTTGVGAEGYGAFVRHSAILGGLTTAQFGTGVRAILNAKCEAMEGGDTVAATSDRGRSLKWVQFI